MARRRRRSKTRLRSSVKRVTKKKGFFSAINNAVAVSFGLQNIAGDALASGGDVGSKISNTIKIGRAHV